MLKVSCFLPASSFIEQNGAELEPKQFRYALEKLSPNSSPADGADLPKILSASLWLDQCKMSSYVCNWEE